MKFDVIDGIFIFDSDEEVQLLPPIQPPSPPPLFIEKLIQEITEESINDPKRTDQNTIKKLSRKLLHLLEKSHEIQPTFKKNQKLLGDIRFFLILIRLFQEQKRHEKIKEVQEMINEENGVNYNDGIKKCHELLRELQENINLNDNMDIEKTLLKMRSAGKSRRPRSIKESDRENVFLEFEQKILKQLIAQ